MENEEIRPVHEYVSSAYLDYSMYVIQDRALPKVQDGLKPVHRRIIYSLSQLGLNYTAKHKKSARAVGDVLGKYHPHGDSACYEAMVLMSQNFSIGNPLVDGQGNWGSVDDPKSFAAMRYTEAKLTKYADTLLSEIKQGTVDYQPNFDGTLKEPVVLPAQLPNILINGGEGIAVGLSTVIPSHNMEEIVSACIAMYKNKNITHEELMGNIQGPDYPTGAEVITPRSSIIETYKKGRGSVTLRAKYEYENGDITITELPFQVYIPTVLQEIAHQVDEKKFNLIQKIKDHGDQDNPVKIVLTLKSNRIDPDEVMNHLFASTSLQVNRSINMSMIGLDNKPRTKGLVEIISEWTQFRQEVFERKKQFRLDKILDRLHILEGLLIVYSILDDVIQIIREEDDPKKELIERVCLSDRQAEAVLELKLRHLAKLEEFKLKGEFDELTKEKSQIEDVLSSDRKIKNAVIKELKAACEEHKSPRRSQIIERAQAKAMDQKELISAHPVTVVLSKKGWIRSAKGHGLDLSKLNYKAGDKYNVHVEMRNNENLIVMSKQGRFYTTSVNDLPNAKTAGEPITTRISLKSGDEILGIYPHKESTEWLLSTKQGLGFIVPTNDLITKNKTGKDVQKFVDGDLANLPIDVTTASYLGIITNQGRYAIIEKSSINTLSKGKGVKLINIPPKDIKSGDDGVRDLFCVNNETVFKVRAGRKVHKIDDSVFDYYLCNRPSRGKFLDSVKKADIKIEM